MELTYATIVVLASMIFVLSGMVGYLYWQQTRMMQNMQSLAIVVSTQLAPPPPPMPMEDEQEEESDEDDRVSVKEEVEHVEAPPAPKEESKEEKVDIDELQDKTKKQLQEMLTTKGIPFGKNDSKSVLIELLKATA